MTTLIGIGISIIVGGVILLGFGAVLSRVDPWKDEDWSVPERADLRPPQIEDPGEWTGPMHTGSGGAEKRMRHYFREIGFLKFRQVSERTHKVMAALDARRPRRQFPIRRAVFTPPPVAEPPLEVHHEPATGPDLLAAPVPGEILPPAPAGDETSPIADALMAELGKGAEEDPFGWIDAWLASPLPGDGPAQAETALYRDWVPDDSGIMRAIKGEAV